MEDDPELRPLVERKNVEPKEPKEPAPAWRGWPKKIDKDVKILENLEQNPLVQVVGVKTKNTAGQLLKSFKHELNSPSMKQAFKDKPETIKLLWAKI